MPLDFDGIRIELIAGSGGADAFTHTADATLLRREPGIPTSSRCYRCALPSLSHRSVNVTSIFWPGTSRRGAKVNPSGGPV